MPLTFSKRLLLHVGQPKAGSTAIQNYLSAQREALLAQGILFPRSVLLRRNPFDKSRTPGHYTLLQALTDPDYASVLDALDAELLQHEDARTLIVSIESLFSDQPDPVLMALAARFQDWDIEIIAVLRALPEWMASRYVEECLSGFRGCLQTPDQFCDEKFARGAHDYAGRLDHLATIFRPSAIHVINYDAAHVGDGLVPAFLQQAGLSATDGALATGIRANVREKELFLVEGKRRLNHAHAHLPALVRQELEHDIRVHAREMALQLPPDIPRFTGDHIEFPPARCREILRSNARLVKEYGLVPPLADPAPHKDSDDPALHKRFIDGADALLTFGLNRMAQLLQAAIPHDAPKPANPHPLALDGHEMLIAQIAAARVIVSMNAPDAAVIATCFHNKLPVYLSSPDIVLHNLHRVSDTCLPSDAVVLDAPDQLAKLLSVTPADLVICPVRTPLRQIADAWACTGADAVLVTCGHDPQKLTDMALHLNLLICAQTGAFAFLARKTTAHKKKAGRT
ncbi:hypothetical protein ACOI1H_23185 [Loktanella sp. DJP18]|uniref:hypothetical protein n=1 Tax=Loktanella sp. DJP18 TaxID=3409788 RepID=UPI003BB700D8